MFSIKKNRSYWYKVWRRKGHQRKLLVSDYPSIDILKLYRVDQSYPQEWNMGPGRFGNSLKLVVEKDRIIISTEERKYAILVSATPCNFGKCRYWLHCPNQNCGKRSRLLYRCYRELFLCRRCLKLGYKSQLLSAEERWIDSRDKIERFLERRGGGIYQKPKRMHRKTYNNYLAQYERYDEKIEHLMSFIEAMYIKD